MLWPGRNIDNRRFVEFLVRFGSLSQEMQKISVVILIRRLEESGESFLASILIERFFRSPLSYYGKSPQYYGDKDSGLYATTLPGIIDPEEIDTEEVTVLLVAPTLAVKDLRRASYASIIYSDVRSGLVHEYELSNNVTHSGWRQTEDKLSYINYFTDPDSGKVMETAKQHNISLDEARDALTRTQRRLYFPYSYIRNTLVEAANAAFSYWDTASDLSHPVPQSWWIDG
jgi:hypothetical protein